MGEYAQIDKTRSQQSSEQAGRSGESYSSGDHLQRDGDGLAGVLNSGARVQPLFQLRQAINATPRVRGQVALQRSLDRRSSGPRPVSSHVNTGEMPVQLRPKQNSITWTKTRVFS